MKKAAPENGRFHPIAGKSRSTNEFRADFFMGFMDLQQVFPGSGKTGRGSRNTHR
jgi:hypothetical protein